MFDGSPQTNAAYVVRAMLPLSTDLVAMSNITLDPVAGIRHPATDILVKMPKPLLAELDAAAVAFRRPRTHLIRAAIVDYLAYLTVISSAGNHACPASTDAARTHVPDLPPHPMKLRSRL